MDELMNQRPKKKAKSKFRLPSAVAKRPAVRTTRAKPKPELPPWPLPKTLPDAMCWAFFILDRFAEVLGVEELKSRLSRAWCANSFFSGIDCVKHAWTFITAASVEMFGISPGVDFALSVEIDKGCQECLLQWFNGGCIFGGLILLVSWGHHVNSSPRWARRKGSRTSNGARNNWSKLDRRYKKQGWCPKCLGILAVEVDITESRGIPKDWLGPWTGSSKNWSR